MVFLEDYIDYTATLFQDGERSDTGFALARCVELKPSRARATRSSGDDRHAVRRRLWRLAL
jgi:hypothetical protein